MRKPGVAVLDIRSTEICAAVAENGVNNTFIIKNKSHVGYDGYAEGELIDIGNFNNAVKEAIAATFSAEYGRLKHIYISVPAEFCEVRLVDKTLGFSSSQAVAQRHLRMLTEMSVPQVGHDMTVIYSSPLYYVLPDNRNVINPLGSVCDSLRGKLSFYVAKSAFLECVRRAVDNCMDIGCYHWIPQIYSQPIYLIDPAIRDGRAVLVDVGGIASSFSVACGNGVEFCESFSVGVGHMAVLLMENLNIPYDAAYAILKSVNLNAKGRLATVEECRINGEYYSFRSSQVREILNEGLDGFCGLIEECRQAYSVSDITNSTIYLTGDGVGVIRGLTEKISSRLVSPVEVIAPRVPYYERPRYSSLFSLLAAAFGE